MTIYQVVYYNHFGERVADFGYYEDKLDAERRALEVRVKTSQTHGKVCVEDVFVEDSSEEAVREKRAEKHHEKECMDTYGFKN